VCLCLCVCVCGVVWNRCDIVQDTAPARDALLDVTACCIVSLFVPGDLWMLWLPAATVHTTEHISHFIHAKECIRIVIKEHTPRPSDDYPRSPSINSTTNGAYCPLLHVCRDADINARECGGCQRGALPGRTLPQRPQCGRAGVDECERNGEGRVRHGGQ
jgi:hypothetical protein